MNHHPFWTTPIVFLLFGTLLCAQGVVKAHRSDANDKPGFFFCDAALVLAFCHGEKGNPTLNVINLAKDEITVDARQITITGNDGKDVHPRVLHLETALKNDPVIRAYFPIKGHSGIYFILSGVSNWPEPFTSVQVQIGRNIHTLSIMRPTVYDAMIERLSRLDLSLPHPARELMRLNIPKTGSTRPVVPGME